VGEGEGLGAEVGEGAEDCWKVVAAGSDDAWGGADRVAVPEEVEAVVGGFLEAEGRCRVGAAGGGEGGGRQVGEVGGLEGEAGPGLADGEAGPAGVAGSVLQFVEQKLRHTTAPALSSPRSSTSPSSSRHCDRRSSPSPIPSPFVIPTGGAGAA